MDKLKGVKILMEVSSNWGHPSLIGLTEIEFFTPQNKKVWLSGTRLMTEGHLNTSELDHILNGKTHSTHEKHMWCSQYRAKRKIRFHFLVPIGTKHDLRAVRIWNYNRPSYLDAGVRSVKIVVENVSVWEGEVPIGCGNTTLNYAHNIVVYIPESSPSNASVTLSPENPIHVTIVEKSADGKDKSADTMKKELNSQPADREEKSADSKVKSADSKVKSAGQIGQSAVRFRATYNPFTGPILATNSEPNTPANKSTPPETKPRSSPQLMNQLIGQPEQLTNQSPQHEVAHLGAEERRHLRHSVSQASILDELFSPPSNQLLEKSYSESELGNLLASDWPVQTPTHGRRSQLRLGTAVTGKARPELPDAELTDVTHLYAPKNNRNPIACSPLPTHSNHANPSRRRTPSLQSSRTEPIISGAKSVPSLDEMLQSLATFQHSHRGRLAPMADATLDQFLEERVRTRDTPLKLEPEPEFKIPELPYGKFLSLSITSTWGDRHYLGLNGIEAFSSDGNKVEVCDIAADPPDINILPG